MKEFRKPLALILFWAIVLGTGGALSFWYLRRPVIENPSEVRGREFARIIMADEGYEPRERAKRWKESLLPLSASEMSLVKELKEGLPSRNLPPEQNAAAIYAELFEEYEALRELYLAQEKGDTLMQVIDGNLGVHESGLEEPMPPDDPDGLYRRLEKLEGLECDLGIDWSQGPHTLLPYMAKMRGFARLLALQAHFDFARGDWERALGNVRLMLVLGNHVRQGPIDVEVLIAHVIERLALDSAVWIALESSGNSEVASRALEVVTAILPREDEVTLTLRTDSKLNASYYLQLLERPGLTALDFFSDLDTSGSNDSPDSLVRRDDAPEDPAARDVAGRRILEWSLGLPNGKLDGEAFDLFVTRMMLMSYVEADRLAAAYEEGIEPYMVVKKELWNKCYNDWREVPHATFARMTLPGLSLLGLQVTEHELKRRGAVTVLEALKRGDGKVEGFLDQFGKEYTVNWFGDTVYFASSSQLRRKGDLDFSLGAKLEREEYLERTAAAKPTEGDGS